MSRRRELADISRELQGKSRARGSLLLLLIIVFLATGFQWARVTKIDDVTRAQGKVVPTGQTQVIQSTEGGVLSQLSVKKGDVVSSGQLLMVFDRKQLQSQLEEAERHSYALRLRIDRLTAEVTGVPFVPDADLDHLSPDVVVSEQQLFEARSNQVKAELSILDRQQEQYQNARENYISQEGTARDMIASIERERQMMQPLVDQKIEPETTMITLSRNVTEWTGKLASAQAESRKIDALLDEVEEKRGAVRARRLADAQAELAKAVAELDTLAPRIEASRQRVSRTEIRSPVHGVVNQIMLTTIGGVAQPGQTLMEIVPSEEGLLIEAYVKPADIAFLYPGQKVKIKITAYDFSRYGGLDGEIVRIGANAITRSAQQAEPVFVVEVRTDQNLLDAQGAALQIIPGMVAQVDILAQRKTVIDYVLRPVVRVKERAFRD